MQTREERDTMGVVEVPAAALWGAQTQRSLQNFRISSERMPVALIHALARVKRAAARVNHDLEEKGSDPKKEKVSDPIKTNHIYVRYLSAYDTILFLDIKSCERPLISTNNY